MTLVLLAAFAALLLSLFVNARQFFENLELSKRRDELLVRLSVGSSGRVHDVTEKQLHDFDAALQVYALATPTAHDVEATATRELIQDLRVLATVGAYAKSAGWPHAFYVVSGIRIRFIVNRFVVARLPSVSAEVPQHIDRLLVLLKAWATLAGFHDDFTQPLAFKGPDAAAQTTWQDLSTAESVATDTQDAAQALLRLIAP